MVLQQDRTVYSLWRRAENRQSEYRQARNAIGRPPTSNREKRAGPLQDPVVDLCNTARGGGAMQPEHRDRIRSICDALVAAGFETLDKQADVLCLPRSTIWNIVHGNHKKSGLSANLLGR